MRRIAFFVGFLITVTTIAVGAVQMEPSLSVVRSDEVVDGSIDDETEFISIPVEIETDGVNIRLDARTLSGDLDTLLYLVDTNGNILAENDDRSNDDIDALIEFPSAPRGNYTVIVTRFGIQDGNTSGEFELNITFEQEDAAIEVFDVSPEALADAGFPLNQPAPVAKWTILAYYGGDTDLESAIMNDFNEFELAGGSGESVRIVALLDRHPEFTDSSGDWNSTRIFEVSADVSADEGINWPPNIDTDPVVDLGDRDTGSGETLAQFLAWGIRTYPAERYAIAFASHGAGWQGLITDYSSNTIITMPELVQAFDTVTQTNGVERFDLLLNDACLMSSVEYHAVMSDYFTLSIASPEIVVDPALDMTILTDTLKSNPDADLINLGQTLVDTYINRDVATRQGSESVFMTQSVTDLRNFSPVVAATELFAQHVNRDPQRYSNIIGLARSNAYTYSYFMGGNTMIDLGHFMQQVIILSDDPDLVEVARNVIQAIETARLYGNAGSHAANWTSYYNIYFPQTSSDFETDYFRESPLQNWGQMLRGYYNIITPRLWVVEDSILAYHPPLAPNVKVTRVYPEVSSTVFPPTISMEVVGRQISNGSFTVDRILPDGTVVRLANTDILTEVISDDRVDLINSWKSGVDQSVFSWLPTSLPVVTDETQSNNEFLLRSGSTATLEGRYREPGSNNWYDATVIFDLEGTTTGVVSRSNASNALASIRIAPGSEFQALRYVVTQNGQVKTEPGNIYAWPETGLKWTEQATESGEYQLGFLVTAFGGTTGFDSVSVTVDNSAVDEAYRGYTDISLGINFQHPADWFTVGSFGDQLFTSNPDQTAAINVFYFESEANFTLMLGELENRYNLEVTSDPIGTTLNGSIRAVEFSLMYTDAADEFHFGRALAFYRQTTLGGRAIVISVDGVRSARGLRDETFRHLKNTLQFFDAATLKETDESEWYYAYLDDTLPYPVRKDWESSTSDDGMWRIHRPAITDDQSTFAAISTQTGTESEAVVDRLLRDHLPDAEIVSRQNYEGEYHHWVTVSYQRTVAERAVAGRLYVTRIGTQVYALNFETRINNLSAAVFRDTFEPMLDGFAPPSNVVYSTGDLQPAFIKAAMVIAEEVCADAERDQLCYGSGTIDILDLNPENTSPFITPGDTRPIRNLDHIDVGFTENGIDPFSVAVVNMQANLPNDPTDENVRLFIFGGTTVTNQSVRFPTRVNSVELTNETGQIINVRIGAGTITPIVDSVQPGQQVSVVARTQDNLWLRVRKPSGGGTGWVYAPLLTENNQSAELPVSTSEDLFFVSMQSLEITLDETASENVLNGVLIQTPPGDDTVLIEINDVLFRIAGGSMLFWQANLEDIEDINPNDAVGGFGQTVSRRRLGGWSSQILQGSIRISIKDDTGNAVEVDSGAGSEITFRDTDSTTSGDTEQDQINDTAGENDRSNDCAQDQEDCPLVNYRQD